MNNYKNRLIEFHPDAWDAMWSAFQNKSLHKDIDLGLHTKAFDKALKDAKDKTDGLINSGIYYAEVPDWENIDTALPYTVIRHRTVKPVYNLDTNEHHVECVHCGAKIEGLTITVDL